MELMKSSASFFANDHTDFASLTHLGLDTVEEQDVGQCDSDSESDANSFDSTQTDRYSHPPIYNASMWNNKK
jgi:hypothetical protein